MSKEIKVLEPELLDNVISLKSVVIVTAGSIKVTNLDELEQLEKDSKTIAGSIKTELNTDFDIADAKKTVTKLKGYENAIAAQTKAAMDKLGEITTANDILTRTSSNLSGARLKLNTLATKKTASRKEEITGDAIQSVKTRIAQTEVHGDFQVNEQLIVKAIHGKKSFDKMEEAVELVVASELERLAELEALYTENMGCILDSEKDNPGLYPDKKALSIRPTAEVKLEIVARVEKQKNDLREAEERKIAEEKAKVAQEAELKLKQEEAAAKDEERRVADTKVFEQIEVPEPNKVISVPDKKWTPLPPEPEPPTLPELPLEPRAPEMLPEHKIEVVIFGEYANVAKLMEGIRDRHPAATVNYLGAR